MICQDIDKAEVSEIQEISKPTEDIPDELVEGLEIPAKAKCVKVLRQRGWIGKNHQTNKFLVEGAVQKALKEGHEHDWYLRKCCWKTAKFTSWDWKF